MNQILSVGNKNGKNNNSTVDIKKIIIFFSIAIIIFGAVLIINGVVGLNKNNNKDKQNTGAVIEETPTPETPANDDEEAPTIELSIAGENINIIARDETEMDYIEYTWNDEQPQIAKASVDDKNRIQATITLKQGTNVLKVTAVDKAGNIQEKTQEFQGKIRPVVTLRKTVQADAVIIKATCEDGLSKIEYTLNGEWTKIPFDEFTYTKEEWETVGVILEYSDDGKIISAEYTQKLLEGENIFNVYAYSKEGLVGTADGKATYPEQQQ